MEYSRLVAVYDRLDATPSTLEKTGIIADTFARVERLYVEQ